MKEKSIKDSVIKVKLLPIETCNFCCHLTEHHDLVKGKWRNWCRKSGRWVNRVRPIVNWCELSDDLSIGKHR